MSRVYNFSAGPSMLPESVLKKAASEMLDYEGSGQSVMEMSHRSKVYEPIIYGAEKLLREIMNIPDNYKVPPGRCFNTVCGYPHELHDRLRQGRLHNNRSVCNKSI